MEDATMENRPAQSLPSGFESVFGAIARWVNNYRDTVATDRQLGDCGPDEVAAIARDLMLAPRDLLTLTRRGPDGARLLQEMLKALGVDGAALSQQDPVVMRDLQRLCVSCGYKRQCERDLADGKLAENYHDYCPNAYTLEMLFDRTTATLAQEDTSKDSAQA
jgi:hypothetical protein